MSAKKKLHRYIEFNEAISDLVRTFSLANSNKERNRIITDVYNIVDNEAIQVLSAAEQFIADNPARAAR